jgi:hypothetical protein
MSIAAENLPLPHRDDRKRKAAAMVFRKMFLHFTALTRTIGTNQ